MPERVAQQIDAYNRATQEEAETAGARWVDITDLSRADPGDVTADGLHPNPAMYGRWVERILPVAHAVLHSTGGARTSRSPHGRA
jgi:lysophospholipase L1-like esterase